MPDTALQLPASLAARLSTNPELPSLPASVLQIVALAESPETNLQEFVTAIERDPALTMRLLGMANSVFHTSGSAVETCHDAISRLGVDTTLSVALGFGLAHHDEQRQNRLGFLTSFWQHALISALIGHTLANYLSLLAPGRAFTLGLLKNTGMLALDACLTDEYAALLAGADSHAAICAAEHTAWGCDHALVGAWLGQRWGLPQRLVDGIAQSHAPLDQVPVEQRCVNAAGALTDAWLASHTTSEVELTPLATALHALSPCLGISDDTLIALLSHLEHMLPSAAQLMHIGYPPEFDAIQLLMQAKRQLHEHHLKLNQTLLDQRQEIERLHQHQADLIQRVRHDSLTGLYNRAHLETLLERYFEDAQAQQSDLSVIFIDLDHFKQLNDRYGHRLGDEVLQGFADLLRELLSAEVVGGRYGGEEFLLLLPNASRETALQVASLLQRNMAERALAVTTEQESVHASASIGIASLTDGDFAIAADLIQAADKSMYAAKNSGRGRIVNYQAKPLPQQP